MTFTGSALDAVAFPLGGIGTGTISLGGRGNLRDWEIFNAPAKGLGGFSSFLLRAAVEGADTAFCRVLERRFLPPYVDRPGMVDGYGMSRIWMAGCPRFEEARFRGEYPLAWLELDDSASPVDVQLHAYTPMAPLAPETSGMPFGRFEWTFRNRTDKRVSLSLAAVFRNPLRQIAPVPAVLTNEARRDDRLTGVVMSSASEDPASCGSVVVASPWAGATAHPALLSENVIGLDRWHRLWDEFRAGGTPVLSAGNPDSASSEDKQDLDSCLLLPAELAPGESVTLPVLLSWHIPTRTRSTLGFALPTDPGRLQNWYANEWSDAWSVAVDAQERAAELAKATTDFHAALFSSTLPPAVLDAVSSQMSTIRTNTCVWLGDGTLHTFEGCSETEGCCPLDCSHVWNYEQSLSYLYPSLARTMRDSDLGRNVRDRGSMSFRTVLPLTEPNMWANLDPNGCLDTPPSADGQMGNVLKVYREWLLSGDQEWLQQLWPEVRRILEFAWESWDADRDGLMEGEQHNTYDIEFYGPNTMSGSLYLGALRAGEEMALALGDSATAATYRKVFESGSMLTDERLWNGEWYVQLVPDSLDLPEQKLALDGSPKNQYGTGCLADQLLGQWFARVVGLGALYDEENIRRTLTSIHRHNFRRDLAEHGNVQRAYALPGEPGLVLCSWPNGGRPDISFFYADEVWTGVEYEVAAACIYEGLVDEGLEIVMAVRSRHAGWNRNPWNEYECGHHYARALSSWSLLLALSGYRYSAAERSLTFDPRLPGEEFRCLFTTGSAWGTVRITADRCELSVLAGDLQLSRLTVRGVARTFDPPVHVTPEHPLDVGLT